MTNFDKKSGYFGYEKADILDMKKRIFRIKKVDISDKKSGYKLYLFSFHFHYDFD